MSFITIGTGDSGYGNMKKWVVVAVLVLMGALFGGLAHPGHALASPCFGCMPGDIIGAPASDAPYSAGYTPSTSYWGYYGRAGGLPSIALFDGNGGWDCVNGGGSGTWYGGMTNMWVSSSSDNSADGSANQPINEAAGATSVGLTFVNMEYICSRATADGNHGPVDDTTVYNDQQQLSNGSYVPHVSDFKVSSVSTSSDQGYNDPTTGTAGTISCNNLAGLLQEIKYQSGTRYWFPTSTASPCGTGANFTFTPYKNVTQDITMTVTIYGTSTFWDPATHAYDQYRCIAGDNKIKDPYPGNDPACAALTFQLHIHINVPASPTPPPPSGPGCPSLSNSDVQVNLPDQSPNNPAPTGASTSPGATYEQDTPQQKTKVTSIQDISPANWGGNAVPITSVAESYQSVTLDYSPYITDYPYDNNQASVTYDSYYNKTNWTSATTPSYYTCNGANNGTNSTCTEPANFSCSTGVQSGTTCTIYYGSTAPDGSCPSGGSPFSGICIAPGTGYYWCPAGTSGPNSSNNCTYPATPMYNWIKGTTTNNLTTSNTVDATQMTPCYNRGFSVTAVNVNTSLDDYEDPTSATSTATANVTFSYPSGTPAWGLRQRMQVNLRYAVVYTGTPSTCPASNIFSVLGGFADGPASGPSPPISTSCPATAPPLQAGSQVCATYTVTPSGTTMSIDGTVQNSNFASVAGTGCSSPLTNMPYVHFMGGDVSAGGAFANGNDACASENPYASANIAAFVKGSGALTRGSGTQFGALSNGSITTFGSAIMRPGTNYPVAQNGLSFANSPTPGGLNMPLCEPDYYSTLPAGAAAVGSPLDISSFNGSPPPSGPPIVTDETYTGNLTIDGVNMPLGGGIGSGIGDGNRVAIYVNGNVYIKNNIVFRSRQSGWTSTSSIPSFYLIVKGNIYLDPSVSELDGVYIAQSNGGTGGVINTCSPGFAAPGYTYAAANLFNNCQSQLTVNGAFIASNVELYRTYASLRNSLGGEYPTGAVSPDNCTAGDHGTVNRASTATSYDCGAEVFNLTPDILLGQPAINANATIDDGKFDFITSLSPVL